MLESNITYFNYAKLDNYSLQYLRELYKNNHMLKIGNICQSEMKAHFAQEPSFPAPLYYKRPLSANSICHWAVSLNFGYLAICVHVFLSDRVNSYIWRPTKWPPQWPSPRRKSTPKSACQRNNMHQSPSSNSALLAPLTLEGRTFYPTRKSRTS